MDYIRDIFIFIFQEAMVLGCNNYIRVYAYWIFGPERFELIIVFGLEVNNLNGGEEWCPQRRIKVKF